MPARELPEIRIAKSILTRARLLAQELNLPADADRSQLISSLARSRIITPVLPVGFDDTRDLEDVLRVIPPEGLKTPPSVGWRIVLPKLPSRQPRYKIKVRAVMCADSDGAHAASISQAALEKLCTEWSNLYYQAGLTFVLSKRVVLKDTMINQDYAVPTGLDMTTVDQPMTQAQIDKSFDEHNKARSAWARKYSGELVVFFRYGTKLLWNDATHLWSVGPASFAFSGPEHEFVVMGQGNPPESTLMSHESGHYFHLGHTHGGLVGLTKEEAAQYPDWQTNPAHRQAGAKIMRDRMAEGIRKFVDDQGHPPDSGLDVMNADGISDTQPDPGPTIFAYEFADACSLGVISVDVNLASGVRAYSVTASLQIIMSYFFRCAGMKRFTDLQIDKIRYTLETPVLTGTVTTNGGATLPILSRNHLIKVKYIRDKGPMVAKKLSVPPPVRKRTRNR